MTKSSFFTCILSLVIVSLMSCSDTKEGNDFPMDKKYWTADDYHTANTQLLILTNTQAELPNVDNSQSAVIFYKMTDTANFAVVTNDNNLGLTNRETFINDIFKEYKEMVRKYTPMDKQDKYKYPVELVKILQFGLALQIPYITIGNEKIAKESDNPKADHTATVLKSNEQVLISNYNLYLDYVNYEDRFTEKAILEYSNGISNYFPRLINQVLPNGDYSEMLERTENMLKKAKNQTLVQELQKLDSLLKEKTKKPS